MPYRTEADYADEPRECDDIIISRSGNRVLKIHRFVGTGRIEARLWFKQGGELVTHRESLRLKEWEAVELGRALIQSAMRRATERVEP